jgi:hypothetical protein
MEQRIYVTYCFRIRRTAKELYPLLKVAVGGGNCVDQQQHLTSVHIFKMV